MRKTARKLLTMALVGTTVISMTGITAFAAEDTNETVEASADEENINIEVGNVNVVAGEDQGYAEGVETYSSRGSATVSTGDVSVTSEEDAYIDGIYAGVNKDGKTDVTVDGDVSVSSKGDVTAISVESYGGETTLSVTGDVNAEGRYADGINVYAGGSGTSDISVDGNVTVTTTGTDEEGGATAITAIPRKDSEVNVAVKGDVVSDGVGIQLDGNTEYTGNADIVIGGVLSGKDIGILFDGAGIKENTSLTVWKIDLNEEGKIADGVEIVDEETEEVTTKQIDVSDFEKTIHYIIKLDQPTEGGVLSVDGTEAIAGYDTAQEGETVLLKVNVKDGYRLAAAYNGKDQKLALKQDADGNYFIVVPKGGGVYLSAGLEKIEETTTEESGTAEKGTVEKVNQTEKKATVAKKATKATNTSNATTTKVSAPQTSDAGNMAWVIVLAASLTGLVIVRKNPNKNAA